MPRDIVAAAFSPPRREAGQGCEAPMGEIFVVNGLNSVHARPFAIRDGLALIGRVHLRPIGRASFGQPSDLSVHDDSSSFVSLARA